MTHLTNTKVNSGFHLSGVDRSSTSLSGWSWGEAHSPIYIG